MNFPRSILLAALLSTSSLPLGVIAQDTAKPAAVPVVPDAAAAAAVAKSFFIALNANDVATVEKYMGPAFREKITQRNGTVADMVAGIGKELGTYVSIADEPLSGDETNVKFFVTFNRSDKGPHTVRVRLLKVDGKWLVNGM